MSYKEKVIIFWKRFRYRLREYLDNIMVYQEYGNTIVRYKKIDPAYSAIKKMAIVNGIKIIWFCSGSPTSDLINAHWVFKEKWNPDVNL